MEHIASTNIATNEDFIGVYPFEPGLNSFQLKDILKVNKVGNTLTAVNSPVFIQQRNVCQHGSGGQNGCYYMSAADDYIRGSAYQSTETETVMFWARQFQDGGFIQKYDGTWDVKHIDWYYEYINNSVICDGGAANSHSFYVYTSDGSTSYRLCDNPNPVVYNTWYSVIFSTNKRHMAGYG